MFLLSLLPLVNTAVSFRNLEQYERMIGPHCYKASSLYYKKRHHSSWILLYEELCISLLNQLSIHIQKHGGLLFIQEKERKEKRL